jgi:hypothetical protein
MVEFLDYEFTLEQLQELSKTYKPQLVFSTHNLLEVYLVARALIAKYGFSEDQFSSQIAELDCKNGKNTFFLIKEVQNFIESLNNFEENLQGFKAHHVIIYNYLYYTEDEKKRLFSEGGQNGIDQNIRVYIQLHPKLKLLREIEESPEKETQLLRVGYKFYSTKRVAGRHNALMDEFPFMYNGLGIVEHESRNFDVIFNKHLNIEEIHRAMDIIDREKENGGYFTGQGRFMNVLASESIVRQRPKVMELLKKVTKIWDEKYDSDVKFEFAKSVIVNSKMSDEVSHSLTFRKSSLRPKL